MVLNNLYFHLLGANEPEKLNIPEGVSFGLVHQNGKTCSYCLMKHHQGLELLKGSCVPFFSSSESNFLIFPPPLPPKQWTTLLFSSGQGRAPTHFVFLSVMAGEDESCTPSASYRLQEKLPGCGATEHCSNMNMFYCHLLEDTILPDCKLDW